MCKFVKLSTCLLAWWDRRGVRRGWRHFQTFILSKLWRLLFWVYDFIQRLSAKCWRISCWPWAILQHLIIPPETIRNKKRFSKMQNSHKNVSQSSDRIFYTKIEQIKKGRKHWPSFCTGQKYSKEMLGINLERFVANVIFRKL